MPGRQRGSAQITSGLKKVFKFDFLVALYTWNGGFTTEIAIRKIINDILLKDGLIVEYIVGNIDRRRY